MLWFAYCYRCTHLLCAYLYNTAQSIYDRNYNCTCTSLMLFVDWFHTLEIQVQYHTELVSPGIWFTNKWSELYTTLYKQYPDVTNCWNVLFHMHPYVLFQKTKNFFLYKSNVFCSFVYRVLCNSGLWKF